MEFLGALFGFLIGAGMVYLWALGEIEAREVSRHERDESPDELLDAITAKRNRERDAAE